MKIASVSSSGSAGLEIAIVFSGPQHHRVAGLMA